MHSPLAQKTHQPHLRRVHSATVCQLAAATQGQAAGAEWRAVQHRARQAGRLQPHSTRTRSAGVLTTSTAVQQQRVVTAGCKVPGTAAEQRVHGSNEVSVSLHRHPQSQQMLLRQPALAAVGVLHNRAPRHCCAYRDQRGSCAGDPSLPRLNNCCWSPANSVNTCHPFSLMSFPHSVQAACVLEGVAPTVGPHLMHCCRWKRSLSSTVASCRSSSSSCFSFRWYLQAQPQHTYSHMFKCHPLPPWSLTASLATGVLGG